MKSWRKPFAILLFLEGCTMPLLWSPPTAFPDIPGGRTFPEGTRGMAVVRDTVWIGELRWKPDTLWIANRAFRLREVDCVSYRFPPDYRPASLRAEALFGGAAGVLLVIATGRSWEKSCTEPGCESIEAFHGLIFMPAILAGLGLSYYALQYPDLRTREHLYRYAFSSDSVAQARCMEILHFYDPLLNSSETLAIPYQDPDS